jgi:hypothetical protein
MAPPPASATAKSAATANKEQRKMEKKYERILNVPRPVSATHPRMSSDRRAAQFAPFAALTGFDALLTETARPTQGEVVLDEAEIASINLKLQEIKDEIGQKPVIFVQFFIPDGKKAGGKVEKYRDSVLKIDENAQELVLQNGQIIPFRYILRLSRE